MVRPLSLRHDIRQLAGDTVTSNTNQFTLIHPWCNIQNHEIFRPGQLSPAKTKAKQKPFVLSGDAYEMWLLMAAECLFGFLKGDELPSFKVAERLRIPFPPAHSNIPDPVHIAKADMDSGVIRRCVAVG